MKTIARSIILIAIALAVTLGGTGCVQAQGFFGNPLVGKQAPDFRLADTTGSSTSLYDLIKGKNAIVFFWATWCPHCREQLKTMTEKMEELQKDNIEIVLVDIGEDAADVRSFLASKRLKFDVLLDEDSSVAGEYNVVGVPTLIFVDKTGKVRASVHGFPNNYEEAFK